MTGRGRGSGDVSSEAVQPTKPSKITKSSKHSFVVIRQCFITNRWGGGPSGTARSNREQCRTLDEVPFALVA